MTSARAGATAYVAVAVTIMTLGGGVLIADNVWLVDQRDTLKAASDAGAIAATSELNRLLDADPNSNAEDLTTALERIARRYVLIILGHLSVDRYALAESTLVVNVNPDIAKRNVTVAVQADTGGRLFSDIFSFASEDGHLVFHVTSDIVTFTTPVEMVLAIDLSDSMLYDLAGNSNRIAVGDRRIDIVKDALENLVQILKPNATDRLANGMVPWTNMVRLSDSDAASWSANGWAAYPSQKTYGVPYRCATVSGIASDCTPPNPVTESLPSTPAEDDASLGCLDGHRMTSTVGTAAAMELKEDFFKTPASRPFAQRYYAALYGSA